MRDKLLELGRRQPYVTGAAMVAIVSAGAVLIPGVPPEEMAFAYLVAVGVAAFYLGVAPALATTVISTVILSVLYFTVLIADPVFGMEVTRSLALLAAFIIVSLAAVAQAREVKRREDEVNANADRAQLLADIGAELSRWTFSESLTTRMSEAILDSSGSTGLVVFRRTEGEELEVRKISEGMQGELDAALDEVRPVVAHWIAHGNVVDGQLLVGNRLSPVDRAEAAHGAQVIPLCSFDSLEGVIYLAPHEDRTPFGPHQLDLVTPIGGMLAMRFEGLRLQAEEADRAALEASEKLRTTLVAGMSHELKTPITVAKVSLGGLMQDAARTQDQNTTRALQEASKALNRLELLVAGLLEMAVIDAEGWRAKMEPSDLGDIIGSALYGLTSHERNRILLDFPEPVREVICDPRQIARVLRVLLGNAFNYSAPGTPITVGVRQDAESVRVWVQDAGPGVDPAERDAIFDRLYRGSAGERAPGSGLGLSIAREIARLHGGDVILADSDGGARFELRLPASSEESNGGVGNDG